MITVVFDKDSANRIVAIYMEGHSGYAEAGSDIICSAASTLFYTAVNALDEMCGLSGFFMINEDTGDGEVNASIRLEDCDSLTDSKVQTILETILWGFRTLEDSANSNGTKYIELIESI